jgi:hypothetical protein
VEVVVTDKSQNLPFGGVHRLVGGSFDETSQTRSVRQMKGVMAISSIHKGCHASRSNVRHRCTAPPTMPSLEH